MRRCHSNKGKTASKTSHLCFGSLTGTPSPLAGLRRAQPSGEGRAGGASATRRRGDAGTRGRANETCGDDCKSPSPLAGEGWGGGERRFYARTVVTVLLLAIPLAAANAQLPRTRLYSISPTGAKAGTAVDVTLASGVDLDEVDRLYFSHAGITAVPKAPNVFTVTVDKAVPPGAYDVLASGLFGISNPRTFVVGTQDETQEVEPNNVVGEAKPIELDKVLNGVIGAATDVDFFKFSGKKDQRILASCSALHLDSRLEAKLELYAADGRRLAEGRNDVRGDPLVDVTLPADGDYILKLYDFQFRGGPEYFYRVRVGSAPYIDYIVPPSGTPGTTSRFTVYGRNLPAGQPAGIELNGRPLEKVIVDVVLPADAAALGSSVPASSVEAFVDGIDYAIDSPNGRSNSIRIAFTTGPLTLEHEPNNQPGQAHVITVPAEFAGQFQEKGDIDLVQFDAKQDDLYYVEVFGQRNGENVDPYFAIDQVVRNAAGAETLTRITEQDDSPANLAANIFDTASDDPVFRFAVPADGTYRVTLRDRYFESRGSPSLVYRLSIRKPNPDFRLVALPYLPAKGDAKQSATWSLGLRKGANEAVDVIALRRDGFDGPIDIAAEGLPAGAVCHGARIDAGQNSTTLVFSAAENAAVWAGQIRIVGKGQYEDAAKTQAAAAAKAAVAPVGAAQVKLDVLVRTTTLGLQAANDGLAKAKEAAATDAKDAILAKAVAEAQKTIEAATQLVKVSNEAKAAVDKKHTDLVAASQKAEADRIAAVQVVARDARAGTVVWTAPDEKSRATSRVARSLGLAILKEQEPYQVKTEPLKLVVHQGQQVLLPITLAKRTGFDADVALAFVGIPKDAKIDLESKPIKAGANSEVLRMFVKNDAPPRTYTAYVKSDAQVPYRRNIFQLERAQAEQTQATQAVTAMAAAVATATTARNAAKTKADADAAVLKQKTDALAAVQAEATAADTAAKAAVAEKPEKEIASAKAAQEAAKQAAAKLAAIQASLTGAEGKVDKKLEEALASATVVSAELANARKALTDITVAADKKIADTAAAAKAAADKLAASQKAVADVQPAAKASQEVLAKSEAALKAATDQSTAATAAKAAADKKVADAEAATKPANVNIFPPSTPILLTVKPAPATLVAAVADGGNIKQGGKTDVKVTVTRANGFSGPVKLSLPLPPGVAGLSAAEVTVPAESNEGVLTIQAAANAPEAKPANLVIRGSITFDGDALVDAPIAIKIVK